MRSFRPASPPLGALAVLYWLLSSGTVLAGSLEPPGPPAPTMKSLDEIGVGTPISALPYTIDVPGFYYLTQDLSLTSGTEHGITITVDDVTVDLMGFTMDGTGTGAFSSGIFMNGKANVEIRNGTIRGFGDGGILELGDGHQHRVIGVRVQDTVGGGVGVAGISLQGLGMLVKDCTVGGSPAGIFTGLGSVVTGNTAIGNTGYGIAASGSVVSNNSVSENGGAGILGTRTQIVGNTANVNNTSNSDSAGGIVVAGDSLVRGNMVYANRQANILAWRSGIGNGNVIEANVVTDSDFGGVGRGIWFQDSGHFYSGNRATGNVIDFDLGSTTQTDGGGNVSY